ncbi:MAG: type II toxin-antitoxin system VapC family toxin [Dokdonella sp.]|nr:type II toxin-antitoxin system VapC family toxin [Dokdonella sp.]
MILVDTSVWVDHLRTSVTKLAELLHADSVMMHSAVLGELACGSLANRSQRIEDWKALPPVKEFCNGAALDLIESHGLMSRGIGLVDVHLLCSVLNHPGCLLWTRDKRLRDIAEELLISFCE